MNKQRIDGMEYSAGYWLATGNRDMLGRSLGVPCATCGEPITDPNTAVYRKEPAVGGGFVGTGPHHAACLSIHVASVSAEETNADTLIVPAERFK